jgi:hypothetical protein
MVMQVSFESSVSIEQKSDVIRVSGFTNLLNKNASAFWRRRRFPEANLTFAVSGVPSPSSIRSLIPDWRRLKLSWRYIYLQLNNHRKAAARARPPSYPPRLDRRLFREKGHCAFNLDDLSDFITAKRAEWGLPKSWSIKNIGRLLVDGGWLRVVSLTSDLYRPKTRFASRLASRFQVALSIKRGSYLSHGTAASLHSLIEPDIGITYVNKEQSPKSSPRHLSQDAIDRAFLRPPRESNYRFWQMDQPNPIQYVILNGKSSHDFDVEWGEGGGTLNMAAYAFQVSKGRSSISWSVLIILEAPPHFSTRALRLKEMQTQAGLLT